MARQCAADNVKFGENHRELCMLRLIAVITLSSLAFTAFAQSAAAAEAEQAWVRKSNVYTNMLLDVQLAHSPEQGSQQGIAKFDQSITDPTRADELIARREFEAALLKIKSARAAETGKNVRQDLDILQKAFNLQFRTEDYGLEHEVPFINASAIVFQGLRGLLDDQVDAARRPAALIRLRKYAGMEPGYQPFTELLKAREIEQIAKPGIIYPSQGEMLTELGRNSNYVEGIAALFKKYKLEGWEPAYAKLQDQLSGYDAWVKSNILPKARSDFRLPPAKYALAFEAYGIDIPPAKIAAMAHAAFSQYQAEMAPLAAQVAKAHGFGASD